MSEQQEHPSQTAELEAEVARLDDRFKRARADLDNYRKRTAKDVDRLVAERTDAMIGDWLEVADSVGRALAMGSEGAVGDGLRAVRDQIDSTLARQGVERTGQPGDAFDPERHEAVDVRPSTDQPDRTIVEVVRPGYTRDGRVLRPALVAVAQHHRDDGAG
ncbi:MAG: GrpE protein [Solirubrobacterales bacterium]|nr:GrpE protein [Solirubrobacterales bacterium]